MPHNVSEGKSVRLYKSARISSFKRIALGKSEGGGKRSSLKGYISQASRHTYHPCSPVTLAIKRYGPGEARVSWGQSFITFQRQEASTIVQSGVREGEANDWWVVREDCHWCTYISKPKWPRCC